MCYQPFLAGYLQGLVHYICHKQKTKKNTRKITTQKWWNRNLTRPYTTCVYDYFCCCRSLYKEQCGADGLHAVENGWYLSVSQGNHTVLNSSCFINNISHDYMDVLYLQNFLKIKNLNFEFSSRENENQATDADNVTESKAIRLITVAIWWFIWRVTYTSTFLSYWNTASPIGTWPDQAGFADICGLRHEYEIWLTAHARMDCSQIWKQKGVRNIHTTKLLCLTKVTKI